MNEEEIQEVNWTEEPVIGILLTEAEHDSMGQPINPNQYYKIGKHAPTGKIILIPTNRNMVNEFMNDMLKKNHKFN